MEEPKPANHVIRYNLLVLLGAAVLAATLAPLTDGGSVIVFGLTFLLQAGINLLLALVNLGKHPAPYFLSMLLVLLVGFGACTGMVATGLINLNV